MDVAIAILVLLVLASVSGAVVWQRRQLRAMAGILAGAEAARADLVRLARMTASDLRGPALGLLGQSEQAAPALRHALVGTCTYLLDLAQLLLDQTDAPCTTRRLRDEVVEVGKLVDFVVSQVVHHLGPGRRVWRLAEELHTMRVRADRRALHQVLLRVVTGAALSTREGDWIEISAGVAGAQWVLSVMDEGAGLSISKTSGGGIETRGLGVGLSLARELMQAHGGALDIESAAQVGTRARMSLPADRVVGAEAEA